MTNIFFVIGLCPATGSAPWGSVQEVQRRRQFAGRDESHEADRVSEGGLCPPELFAGGFGNPLRVPIKIRIGGVAARRERARARPGPRCGGRARAPHPTPPTS